VAHFLVDEDLPRSTAVALEGAGYQAVDVRDIGLRGHDDQEVFARAQELRAVLVTADRGFANLLAFPPGGHFGILVLRLPNELSTRELNEILVRAVHELGAEDLHGALVVVQQHRVRLRRSSPLGF
jgi:predicted nuclease of predicted toxin-antitoxin system